MKKFPKIIQVDKRGQIVIPKDIRADLGVEEGTGFYMYTVTDEGILLKKIKDEHFEDNKEILSELDEKAEKIDLKKTNLKKTAENYKKTKEGRFDLIWNYKHSC